MRFLICLTTVYCFACVFDARAEGAAELREKGIQALKLSETDQHAIVEAARLFAKAADAYSDAGDEEHAVEVMSYLYWCRKKMTLEREEGNGILFHSNQGRRCPPVL